MASRDEINTSEEPAHSAFMAKDLIESFLNAEDLELELDSIILKRCLSLNSVVSMASFFNGRSQTVNIYSDRQEVNQIGCGLQGAIFEVVGQTDVFKKEHPGNELRSSNLQREFRTHCNVSAAFELYKTTTFSVVKVPKPKNFVPKAQREWFWVFILPNLPQDYRTRGDVITMDRILPLPKIVRRALLTFFYAGENPRPCNESEVERLHNNKENKHCLARVYLGKGNGSYNQGNPAPLRNFPLYLDSMKALDMDTLVLAKEMGKAYAIMHWGAATNGDDVEFVLGTSALKRPADSEHIDRPNVQHRAIGLYLLDFGQCEAVDLTRDCDVVYQEFKGAMVMGDNQLFIPHVSKSPELFATFKKGYIDAGNVILSDKKLSDKFSMEDFMQEYEEYAEDFVY